MARLQLPAPGSQIGRRKGESSTPRWSFGSKTISFPRMKKQYGPFNARDAGNIEKLLTEAGAEFTRTLDDELFRQQNEKFSQVDPLLGGVKEDFACIYFDIADSDVLRLHDEIGAYGIDPSNFVAEKAPVDFDHSAHYCPQCDYEQDGPGLCPKHQEKLLSDDEWLKLKNAKTEPNAKSGLILIVVIVALSIFFLFRG